MDGLALARFGHLRNTDRSSRTMVIGENGMNDADRRSLHEEGYLELSGVPDWELIAFCERMHADWNERCIELLDGLRSRWFEDCEHGARTGHVVARVANEVLSKELAGIWLTATHASVDEDSWEFTGPRFYASIITAARRPHTGCCGADGKAVPRASEDLEALLWPASVDAEAPWVTELGWTVRGLTLTL